MQNCRESLKGSIPIRPGDGSTDIHGTPCPLVIDFDQNGIQFFNEVGKNLVVDPSNTKGGGVYGYRLMASTPLPPYVYVLLV